LRGIRCFSLSRNNFGEAHFAVSPVLMGEGEMVFAGPDLPALGCPVTRQITGDGANHVVIGRD
jgi:hypothetical protein